MKIIGTIIFSVVVSSVCCSQDGDYRKLHFDAVVADTHNDVVQRILAGEDISLLTHHGHSDIPRFIEGGVDVQIFSIWVPPEQIFPGYYEQSNQQIDAVESLARRTPDRMEMAYSTRDIDRIIRQGKIAAMLGMEGGHPIDNDLKKLEHFYKRGVRYMTLTWNNSVDWATSAKDETDPDTALKHKGLTGFGNQIVKRMNELGMLIDISHVGEQTFWDVMKITSKPVIASHSSAWTLCPHRRNLKDDQLKAIQKNGGVVFINFNPGFIDSTFTRKEQAMLRRNKPKVDSLEQSVAAAGFVKGQYAAELLKDEYEPFRPSLETLMNHFDYIAKLIGVDHVGIGSDFDGIEVTPRDMDDVTRLPNITRELLRRGYSENDVRKILGENFRRVLREAEHH